MSNDKDPVEVTPNEKTIAAMEEARKLSANKDPYVFFHDGKPAGRLNERLAKQRNITPEQLATLTALHELKHEVYDKMQATDDPEELKKRARQVTAIEFQLQANWNFSLDQTFHEWYLVPKCRCPKIDNAERKGTPYGIRAQNCPIHGWNNEADLSS